jgi:sorbitol/mannitol transport system substrate-binding protein
VTCDVPKPSQPTTVNVLAYNSSAIDPFTNTMVSSCSKNDYTSSTSRSTSRPGAEDDGDPGGGQRHLRHRRDLRVRHPAVRLAEQARPLDDLFAKHAEAYKLNDISKEMRAAMTYDGKLYALPMQAQMYIMAYRKDRLRPGRPQAADHLRGAEVGRQDPPGQGGHQVPDRPPLARNR